MIYAALGDSITFGENASSLAKAYPALVASMVSASSRRPIESYVLAHPGWDSRDLLGAINFEGGPILRVAAVVSVWIGGIDLLEQSQTATTARFVKDHERVMRNILSRIKQVSRARLVCCTQYNPFPASPLAVKAIAALNQSTIAAARHCGALVAPAHSWFEGRQPALIHGYRAGKIEDALTGKLPIHPNDRGHRVIAEGLLPYVLRKA